MSDRNFVSPSATKSASTLDCVAASMVFPDEEHDVKKDAVKPGRHKRAAQD
jgi:hypothetical protein